MGVGGKHGAMGQSLPSQMSLCLCNIQFGIHAKKNKQGNEGP